MFAAAGRTSMPWLSRVAFQSPAPLRRALHSGKATRFTPKDFEAMRAARTARRREYGVSVVLYASSTIIIATTLAYASVPLYRAICSRTGFGGTPITDATKFSPERMKAVDRGQRIAVKFSSEVSSHMPWQFKPEQREVQVLPGETALAFYKAKNVGTEPLIGMATYTVVPERAAAYFSKIQCFCFEEQLLMPGEEVDMPVFFFLDPDYARDPAMANTNDIVLHYTFFKAQYRDGSEAQVASELSKSLEVKKAAPPVAVPAHA